MAEQSPGDAPNEDVEAPKFNIAKAFENKARALEASFLAIRHVTTHPGTKGDELEADWVGLIRDFLPTRYEVGPIFAVDHHGNMSQQIDVRFVPVESVYAVFEVKPELNKKYVEYAIEKVRSVRTLERTSANVVHKGGVYDRTDIPLSPIIGGILSMRSGWAAEKLLENLDAYQPADPSDDGFLNIGIALDTLCFDHTPTLVGNNVVTSRTQSSPDQQLIHFAVRLFRQLQALGSVPAVDMLKYEAAFSRSE
jgi:hypothetical protein